MSSIIQGDILNSKNRENNLVKFFKYLNSVTLILSLLQSLEPSRLPTPNKENKLYIFIKFSNISRISEKTNFVKNNRPLDMHGTVKVRFIPKLTLTFPAETSFPAQLQVITELPGEQAWF